MTTSTLMPGGESPATHSDTLRRTRGQQWWPRCSQWHLHMQSRARQQPMRKWTKWSVQTWWPLQVTVPESSPHPRPRSYAEHKITLRPRASSRAIEYGIHDPALRDNNVPASIAPMVPAQTAVDVPALTTCRSRTEPALETGRALTSE
eukprot:CAMPEP_0115851342 /NCGR_PEP_ID=MMETSP0287-20121206/12432_1 /TAXON_ID=412157 /ORGANISM="Chrysochromulina rotalis, Strain UIO044" /LENGTH=147 /DNA_ID=CAMNT_0003305371 /DNA_START=63 /DNA_END=506 /DNA_ORIENTATION=+